MANSGPQKEHRFLDNETVWKEIEYMLGEQFAYNDYHGNKPTAYASTTCIFSREIDALAKTAKENLEHQKSEKITINSKRLSDTTCYNR